MRRFLPLIFMALCSCASSSDEEEIVENPNVPAAAFIAEDMTFYVEPPLHPEFNPVKFYFKSCDENGIGNHYSKTSYHCSYP